MHNLGRSLVLVSVFATPNKQRVTVPVVHYSMFRESLFEPSERLAPAKSSQHTTCVKGNQENLFFLRVLDLKYSRTRVDFSNAVILVQTTSKTDISIEVLYR